MNLFTIEIENKEYIYIDSIIMNDKKYVAYMDEKNVYVSRSEGIETLMFKSISDEEYKKVIEALQL